MTSIYRLRPINENTIDELTNNYLWFSKPSGFKGDVEDANIHLMIDSNDILQRAFSLVLNDKGMDELMSAMKHIGICCFTKDLPSIDNRYHFPNGNKSICIEYDRDKLTELFLSKHYLPKCFKDVIYTDEPVKVEADGQYHILMHKDEDWECYESIQNMKRDPNRFMDKLLFFLLTRINDRFSKQKEERIIWAGWRIKVSEENGYKIPILKDCVKKIYLYPGTSQEYIYLLNDLGYITESI